MHPSVIADALPPSLAGKALRTAAPLESLPLQGRWMRRKAQTEGYGAFLGLYPRGLAGACRRVALPHCPLACCLPPKPSAPLRRGRCLRRPATPVSPPMLPGGRNRPPYRPGQMAGGTGNVVPTTSIYLSCRPFAADRRAGVHARRKTFRSMRFFGSMFTFTRKPSASHQPLRKDRGIPAGEIAPSARFFEHAPGVRTTKIPHC